MGIELTQSGRQEEAPASAAQTGRDGQFAVWLRKAINGATRRIWKPRYIGFEHIPETGPAILISNHVSYLDGPIIDAGCKRPVRYLIDEDIYHLPIVNTVMRLNRAIPIAPRRASVEAAFDAISEGLRAGDVICIFPEGFLTFTGGLGRFRPGIEWIIRRDAVPVVPIALLGLWGSLFSRKYRGSLRRFLPHKKLKVTAICGPAMPASEVNVNQLQDVVLKLKYSLLEQSF